MRNLSVSLLFFLVWACPALADETPDVLKQFYSNVRSIQADFRQVQKTADGEILDVFEGQLWMQRPDRFRWEYQTPYKQLIVADGIDLWLFDEDLAQVTVRPIGNGLQGTPARLLSGGANLADEFQLSSKKAEDGLDWVGMIPKSEESDFERIDVAFLNAEPVHIRLQDKLGQETWIQFYQIESNTALAAEHFSFVVPTGIELVGEPSGQ